MPKIGTNRTGHYSLVTLLLFLLVGCARSAPDLPDQRVGKSDEEVKLMLGVSEADLSMNCDEISTALYNLHTKVEENELEIKGDRTHNQVVGYLGGLFLLPALAAENNTESKEQLDSLQARKDQLIYLQQRKCN